MRHFGWMVLVSAAVATACSSDGADGGGGSGGAWSGGASTTGGVATTTGGGPSGAGAATAGAATGGAATGGAATGGAATGGAATGGKASAGDGGQAVAGGGAMGGTAGAPTGGASAGTGGAGASGGAAGGMPSGGSGGATPQGCDPAQSKQTREVVAKAIDGLFLKKDASAVDQYWADPYLQHNPIAKSGLSTFKSLIGGFVTSGSFNYELFLTLGECDLGVVYGRYSQTGVIFDMFRVKDGKIMEHWDSENGASESTGIVPLAETADASRNHQRFLDFANQVLIPGDYAKAGDFLSESFTEHHGGKATGLEAFENFVEADGVTYTKVHHVIADGNYVFAISEGKRGGSSFGFYDLFRVEGGKFVEHWDARRSVPSSTMSGLPIF